MLQNYLFLLFGGVFNSIIVTYGIPAGCYVNSIYSYIYIYIYTPHDGMLYVYTCSCVCVVTVSRTIHVCCIVCGNVAVIVLQPRSSLYT